MWGKQNCLSFEMAVGGIEPPSPRLRVRPSAARPPLPNKTACSITMNGGMNCILIQFTQQSIIILHVCFLVTHLGN